MIPSKYSQTRRLFLRRSVALGAAGMAPLVYRLEAMAAAGAQNVDSRIIVPKAGQSLNNVPVDYKALVCLFMYGGNDCANFIIPYDTNDYNQYALNRTNLAISRLGTTPGDALVNNRGLIPIGPLASQSGRTLAFHPNVGLKNVTITTTPAQLRGDGIPWLWDNSKLAIVANAGPLAVPMTKTEYSNKSKTRPQNLFSHSDQQTTWMTSAATGYSATGVAGRIADLVDSMNVPPIGQPKISTCISIAGVNPYQVADVAPAYQLNSSGPTDLNFPYFNYTGAGAISTAISTAFNEQITRSRNNFFETQWGGMMNYSLQTKNAIKAALAAPANILPGVSPSFGFRTSGNSLSSQLLMVAKLINAGAQLGVARQIFFVQIGGFDVHGTEFHPQNNTNWNKISEAVRDFYQKMVDIGADQKVTLFSASDFGRTLDSNGLGSDHGWGAHHFVVGGAVNGGNMYGTFPTVALGSNDDIGRGSLLPTTSTDQFHATLAKWFGLTDSQVLSVLPNLGAFSPTYLDFLPH
ncbi:MAG: DUF1501 domain-containing protein [Betaproteobacteria bacterium]